MVIVGWVVSSFLLVVFLGLAVSNWVIGVRRMVPPGTSVSWIPLVGGVAGAAGLALVPGGGACGWWWMPFIVDFGSLPGILLSLLWPLIHGRQGRE